MMEGLAFLGDEYDIVAPGRAYIRYRVIESSTEEITRYGGFGMLS